MRVLRSEASPAHGNRKVLVTRCCARGRPKKRPWGGLSSGRGVTTRQTQRERSKTLPQTGEDRTAGSRARGSCRVAEFGKRRISFWPSEAGAGDLTNHGGPVIVAGGLARANLGRRKASTQGRAGEATS